MEQFTKLYSIQKTLCFELQPEGILPEKIQELLAKDKERYLLSPKVKEMMNELHKSFITRTLRNLVENNNFEKEEICDAKSRIKKLIYDIYQRSIKIAKSDEEKTELEQKKAELRYYLSLLFTKDDFYGNLFNESILEELRNHVSNDERKTNILDKFKGFFGYFDTFCTNRKNMYVADEQETAIPFRIANQNLPKFCNNLVVYQRIKSSALADCTTKVYSDFEDMLNVGSLDEYFSIDNYLNCLCQTDIQAYNYIVGGREQEGTKVLLKGLNQYINEYNQTHSKTERLPLFKPLFKQILSDKEKVSWLPEDFTSDAEMLQAIKLCYKELESFLTSEKECSLSVLLQNISSFNQEGIYIQNGDCLNLLSKRLYGGYSIISDAIKQVWKGNHERGKRESEEKYEKKCNDAIKKESAFSLYAINQALDIVSETEKRTIADYYAKLGADRECGKTYVQELSELYEKAKSALNTKDKDIINDDAKVGAIKALLDQLKTIQHYIEPLHMKNVEESSDADFYNIYDQIYEQLDKVTSLYTRVKNRLSRKPYNDNKFPIYFENNSHLLDGWTENNTKSDLGTQYGGYLFRKKNELEEYDYYLGISKNTKLFRFFKEIEPSDSSEYQRLNYYQLKSQTFYGRCYRTAVGHDFDDDKTKLVNQILKLCDKYASQVMKETINKERAKGSKKLKSPTSLLDFIKKKNIECYKKILVDESFRKLDAIVTENIKKTMASVNIQFLQDAANNDYESFLQAMDVVEKGCAAERIFEYFPISQSELDAALTSDSKRLFLFRITNKDLSYSKNYKQRKSRGTDNLHTMFFKALMEGGYGTYALGTGSLYFREMTPGLAKDKPTHPRNVPIEKKSVFFQKQKKHSIFKYDIQKDRRFTRNMFKLHFSIKANYTCGNANETILNQKVIETIRNREVKHIIGIDRGERHLLYVTVIDLNGKLVDKFSMNIMESEKIIDGEKVKTDYKSLLDSRMNLRTEQKKTWRHQNSIKDLKEGYLSQVVHKLTKMIVDDYHAIVVLENLNKGFMQTQIESSVYSKFEQMLITKLNLYVDKQKNKNEAGGLYKPLQLTFPYKSRANAGIQNGVVFYIPAWNTSKIDPVTGFVNFIHPKYENIMSAREFIGKFENICYNAERDYFEFHINNYTAFNPKAKSSRQDWVICTKGKRIRNFRDPNNNNEWTSEEIDLTEKFKTLFDEYDIDYHSDLYTSILIQEKKSFFYNEDARKSSLFSLLKLTLQLRNSFIKSDIDYILSPVADRNGVFYDSNKCASHLPDNADANGAFNIARKGLMLVERILSTSSDEQLSLTISNEEWLQYVQSQQ